MTPNLNLQPDIKVSIKQTFGFDTKMEVDAFSKRLQVQERLTTEIRDCIQEVLQPKGVAVVIEASHMCMQMRGVQKQNSATTTSAFTGLFLNNDATRKEFINLIK